MEPVPTRGGGIAADAAAPSLRGAQTKQHAVSQPGDLVEVDTLDVRPVPGVVFKQFTARDVVSRWDVIQAHTSATAFAATEFLDTLQLRTRFPFARCRSMAAQSSLPSSEQACSPKLNGAVERANRTHTEEFYQVTPCSLEMNKLNRETSTRALTCRDSARTMTGPKDGPLPGDRPNHFELSRHRQIRRRRHGHRLLRPKIPDSAVLSR